MRQLGRLPAKSERQSMGMSAIELECVHGGSVTHPHFILSFILRHRPIFDVSDFPMFLVFSVFHRSHLNPHRPPKSLSHICHTFRVESRR